MKSFCLCYYGLVAIVMFLTGCTQKPEKVFDFESKFEKVSTIDLKEVDEMPPTFLFIESGFYSWETGYSRITKYSKKGNYEFSYGEKGSGPCEIELGYVTYYSQDEQILGILDIMKFTFSYFSNSGDFLYSELLKITRIPEFQFIKNGIDVNTFTELPNNSTKRKFNTVITVNDERILEKEIDENERRTYRYSFQIIDDKVYIFDNSETDLDVYVYQPDIKELAKIQLDKKHIRNTKKKPIYAFTVYDNYLIFTHLSYLYYYDLNGNYLGCYNAEESVQWKYAVAGAYDDNLYVLRREKINKDYQQFMDVYKVK
jgi:hypothetical protein